MHWSSFFVIDSEVDWIEANRLCKKEGIFSIFKFKIYLNP